MRRLHRVALVLGVVALLGVPTSLLAVGPGIATSAHDFSDTNTSVGLCTFCHTPHKAQTTRLLWNHTLSANNFEWTDTTVTTGGTPMATIETTWNGPTRMCLSCHDGSVAIGDIAWFDATGPYDGVTEPIIDNTLHDTDPFNIAAPADGNMDGNHPVAHPFPFGGVANTYNTSTSGALAVASGWVADPTSVVSTSGTIRLFSENGSANNPFACDASTCPPGTAVGIECSSCHDPHNKDTPTAPEYFLRGTLNGADADYICTKCHDK